MSRKKVTFGSLRQQKQNGEKITMLTAYDYPSARLLDEAGVDTILVGDSAANVVLGYDNTVPVTMDELLVLTKAVVKGAKSAMIIGDMPFMSYNISIPEAIRNAGRFIKEAGTDAIKLEGGGPMVDTIAAIINAGIPVVGHLGLTPQTASMMGGYRVQGRTAKQARHLQHEAERIQDAGAVMLVLEMVPDRVAKRIAETLDIPVIGIGAGVDVDGQVLVLHDMLGIGNGAGLKFVKTYASLEDNIKNAAKDYIADVKAMTFPADAHTFHMPEDEFSKF